MPTGGTELPWVTNLRAIYEAEHASIMPFAAGDAGGGTVTSEIYSWGVSGGDGSNSIWMGSEPGGNGYYFADMHSAVSSTEDALAATMSTAAKATTKRSSRSSPAMRRPTRAVPTTSPHRP